MQKRAMNKKIITIEIPEGYEVGTKIISHDSVCIDFKKIEEKNFDWYVDEYFKRNIAYETITIRLKTGDFTTVPFENKIGLLKFICDDIGIKWGYFNAFSTNRRELSVDNAIKLRNMLPKGFYNSIFQ